MCWWQRWGERMSEKVIALAGNPNVGKSTVFNSLTGMRQHTGNWPGKTVSNARGRCISAQRAYTLVDIPGTYSLMAHSQEEEIARNFICFGNPDATVVVCDATCLERNLNLVLQTLEISDKVIVCVNLLDEAKRKNIHINLEVLSRRLGVPVIGTVARKKKSLVQLLGTLDMVTDEGYAAEPAGAVYPEPVEQMAAILELFLEKRWGSRINSRWLSLRLLEGEEALVKEASSFLGENLEENKELEQLLEKARAVLEAEGITRETLKDVFVSGLIKAAEEISSETVRQEKGYHSFDMKLDRILTGKVAGYPLMLILLAGIFWITIVGANYPSRFLAGILFQGQDKLTELFLYFHAPPWLHGALVLGLYRVMAWVVSVMLPPMAIFFPLFTLLEDLGYLPRIAYNLDKPFKCCCACGKQALCMAMGFGCNAVGVEGCRIIDSPRERLLAILTNTFVPCNGRFPALIAVLTMFFVGGAGGAASSWLPAVLLTAVICLGIAMTFAVTKLLSMTILKGVPSSFTLELPPYRRPQVGRVIVRSVFDRTFFVLGRAVLVAAPAGLAIWMMANIQVAGGSVLSHCSSFLDPFGRLMGLDGVILLAFILGFPANEIVIPIILMAYLSQGTLLELESLTQMKQIFVQNGWTWTTAVSMILFSLMHWPCSTTLLTIKKETGSLRWTLLAAAIPTAAGVLCCVLFTVIAGCFS